MNIFNKFLISVINIVKDILSEPVKRKIPAPKLKLSDIINNDFYQKLVFVEECGHHKILRDLETNLFYIKKRKIIAHRKNRSKLILDGNKKIRSFTKIEQARAWVGRRWTEKYGYKAQIKKPSY